MDSVTESELSDGTSFSDGGLNQKRFKCYIDGCRKKFRKGWLLENHLRRHNGERPFVCDIENCTKSYTNDAHLKRHVSMVHKRTEELCCDIPGCGLVLNNQYSLRKHKKRMHEEANPCAQCTQKFKKKRLLNEHMIAHNGPAPFRCEKCNTDFYSQIKFTKHKSNHKTFICDCGDTFTKWTLFCQHRRQTCKININHKCIICYKVFSTQRNLRNHSLVHLEESQKTTFNCHFPNCSRSYLYKKNLTAHIAVFHEKQSNSKESVCLESNCGSVFKYKKNLKEHMKNVHGEAQTGDKRARAPRKDQGKPKTSMASFLSGIALTNEEHKTLLIGKSLKNIKMNALSKVSERNNTFANHTDSSLQNMTIDIIIEPNQVHQGHPVDGPTLNASQEALDPSSKAKDHLEVGEDILLKLCNETLQKIQ